MPDSLANLADPRCDDEALEPAADYSAEPETELSKLAVVEARHGRISVGQRSLDFSRPADLDGRQGWGTRPVICLDSKFARPPGGRAKQVGRALADERSAPASLNAAVSKSDTLPRVAIQGGHFTVSRVSVVPCDSPEPEFCGDAPIKVLEDGRRVRILSLRSYARRAAADEKCQTLIATPERPLIGHPIRARNGDFWWTEATAELLEDPEVTIKYVMVIRYRFVVAAIDDLRRAVAALEMSQSNGKLFILIGDLALTPEMRAWDRELYLPRGFRSVLKDADYELLLESKCRNVGKRRLLDRVCKKWRKQSEIKNKWFQDTGAVMVESKVSRCLQLASASILDMRSRLNTKGPVNLLYASRNATCALILAGMLEHFRRIGFETSLLFFDRRDDPHIRNKVGDACAAHAILCKWLGDCADIRVRLQSSERCVDSWESSYFIEADELDMRNVLLDEVSSALNLEEVPVDNHCSKRYSGALRGKRANPKSSRAVSKSPTQKGCRGTDSPGVGCGPGVKCRTHAATVV